MERFINRDFAAKIGQVILFRNLMDRECNYSLPSKVNGKFIYKDKCRRNVLIYKVRLSQCYDIYIDNTYQTFVKRTDGYFSNVERLLKNVKI